MTYFPHQVVFLVVGLDVVGLDVVGLDEGATLQPRSKIPRPSGCGFLSSFESAISYKILELSELAMVVSTSILVE